MLTAVCPFVNIQNNTSRRVADGQMELDCRSEGMGLHLDRGGGGAAEGPAAKEARGDRIGIVTLFRCESNSLILAENLLSTGRQRQRHGVSGLQKQQSINMILHEVNEKAQN